jgi:hypothetical protein
MARSHASTICRTTSSFGALKPIIAARGSRGDVYEDGTNGLKVYPFVVVGGGVLLIALTVVAHATSQPDGFRYPLYAAALASVGYLLATARAAPLMWSLRTTPDDPRVLEEKLDRFAFWHTWRTTFSTRRLHCAPGGVGVTATPRLLIAALSMPAWGSGRPRSTHQTSAGPAPNRSRRLLCRRHRFSRRGPPVVTHSHTDEVADFYAGLIGRIVVPVATAP